MGCHPNALERIDAGIRSVAGKVGGAEVIDHLLDRRFDAVHRATEWDAERWGFDPDRWCEAERAEMNGRARG